MINSFFSSTSHMALMKISNVDLYGVELYFSKIVSKLFIWQNDSLGRYSNMDLIKSSWRSFLKVIKFQFDKCSQILFNNSFTILACCFRRKLPTNCQWWIDGMMHDPAGNLKCLKYHIWVIFKVGVTLFNRILNILSSTEVLSNAIASGIPNIMVLGQL